MKIIMPTLAISSIYNCKNGTFFNDSASKNNFNLEIFGLTETEHDYHYVYLFNDFEHAYKDTKLNLFMPELNIELYFRDSAFKTDSLKDEKFFAQIKMDDYALNKPILMKKYIKLKVNEIKKSIEIKCGV